MSELTRQRGDRRLYALNGVGTVRLEGMFSRSATAEAGGRSWHFSRRGFWQRIIKATDEAGTLEDEFVPREIRRGGTLRWAGRELELRPVSPLRERYTLSDSDRDLVLLDAKSWGRRPVKLTLVDREAIASGLLLFAAYVVHQLAVKAANATSAASSTVASSGAYSGS